MANLRSLASAADPPCLCVRAGMPSRGASWLRLVRKRSSQPRYQRPPGWPLGCGATLLVHAGVAPGRLLVPRLPKLPAGYSGLTSAPAPMLLAPSSSRYAAVRGASWLVLAPVLAGVCRWDRLAVAAGGIEGPAEDRRILPVGPVPRAAGDGSAQLAGPVGRAASD